MRGRVRKALWTSLIVGFLGLLYSATGALQALWLRATPDYPLDRATTNFYIWGVVSLTLFFFVAVIGVTLYRTRSRTI